MWTPDGRPEPGDRGLRHAPPRRRDAQHEPRDQEGHEHEAVHEVTLHREADI
jgi:hypothetical protein